MTSDQRENLFFGLLCLGALLWLVLSMLRHWKDVRWGPRLAALLVFLGLLAVVLGVAGEFWNPLTAWADHLLVVVVAVVGVAFVVGWIYVLGLVGAGLMKEWWELKSRREPALVLVYLVVVGSLVAAQLLDAITVGWGLVVAVASAGLLVMFGLNDYLGKKERETGDDASDESRTIFFRDEETLRESNPADMATTTDVALACIYAVLMVEEHEIWRNGYESLDSFYAAHEERHPDIRVYAAVARQVFEDDDSPSPDVTGKDIAEQIKNAVIIAMLKSAFAEELAETD